MNQQAFTVRMDSELSKQFSSHCENRISFELSLQPNELTKKTIVLAEEGKKLNGPYSTIEDLKASLDG